LTTDKAKRWLWAFTLLFWCIPYFHARLSSENFGTTIFLYALVMLLERLDGKAGFVSLFVSGFLFGLAFVCRFQLSFMLVGLLAWLLFIKKIPVGYYVKTIAGFIVALGLGALVDKWLYGQWTLSWWNYLYQNFFENKASNYGESPFYFYAGEALLQLIPPFSLVIVAALIGFWIRFRKHILTWITMPFILLHFFVAHKELRFLFPALNFLPAMIVIYFHSLREKDTPLLRFLRHKGFLRFAITVNVLLLCFFTFKPADETSASLKQIYNHVKGGNPVLYYDEKNPYNNNAGLNYFRNNKIQTVAIKADTLVRAVKGDEYYFSEKFGEADPLVKNGKTFVRIYSNFPDWFSHFNFNGWLDRAVTYSIYKRQD
jgi:phosphatidylinositol glycan class B